MAKKPSLSDLEKKVTKEELELSKLQDKKEELTKAHQKALEDLDQKIKAQSIKVTEAETNRNLYLLTTSSKGYEEFKAFALGQERGGDGHVHGDQYRKP